MNFNPLPARDFYLTRQWEHYTANGSRTVMYPSYWRGYRRPWSYSRLTIWKRVKGKGVPVLTWFASKEDRILYKQINDPHYRWFAHFRMLTRRQIYFSVGAHLKKDWASVNWNMTQEHRLDYLQKHRW